MDQRIVQLSRTVEELLQASFDLLEASEHDDALVNRGVSQPPNRLPMEQLMLSHRAANGVSERLLLDIQQAEIALKRLRAQGWEPSTGTSAAGALPGKPKPVAGAVMPVDRIAALEEYQRAMQECLLAPA